MRRVVRGDVPVPERLINLTPENLLQLNDHEKISNSVYAHSDVKKSLSLLYHDKCYICECSVDSGKYDVEHYKPKKHFPSLGYTWSNLHKSCDKCNLAKERKDFFKKNSQGTVIDMLLLDPSSEFYNIEDYISFNINSKVELVGIGNDPLVLEKANITRLYLNGDLDIDYGKELPYLRESRSKSFIIYCIDNLMKYKSRISFLKNNILNYAAPVHGHELDEEQDLCSKLINLDLVYISEEAEFSTCIRVGLYKILGINYQQFLNIKNTLKHHLQL
ncbi:MULTISPECIES: HNH endonuclease [Kosakonia]|uniref:HNH endonuclease n=1 Tax=Kosakonia TaxID=1330547 RepID=UPI0006976E2F|nr:MULTISPECIES: HNH endonuclease [Kosakonia]QHM92815.1 HNH endonuclease [Kosakonia sacchari]RCW98383.1 uncharacterized protein (TIGR02646 family) [Kosakonia sp. AG348]